MTTAQHPHCTCCIKKDKETGNDIPDSGMRMVKLATTLEAGTEVFVCPKCEGANFIKIATSNYGPPEE